MRIFDPLAQASYGDKRTS